MEEREELLRLRGEEIQEELAIRRAAARLARQERVMEAEMLRFENHQDAAELRIEQERRREGWIRTGSPPRLRGRRAIHRRAR